MRDRIDLEEVSKKSNERRWQNRWPWYPILILLAIAILMTLIMPPLRDRVEQYLDRPDTSFATSLSYAALLAFILVVIVGGVGASLWIVGKTLVHSMRDKQKAGEMLWQVLPDVTAEKLAAPMTQTLPIRKRVEATIPTILLIMIEIPLMVGIYLLVSWFWSGVPGWVYLLIAITLTGLGSPLIQRAWFAIRPPDPPRELPPLGKEMRRIVLQMLALVLFVGTIMFLNIRGFAWLSEHLQNPAVSSILMLIGTLLLGLTGMLVFLMAPFYWVLGPVKQADYEGALRRVKTLQRIQPNSASWSFLEGTVLDYAGRHEEAEKLLKVSLTEGQQSASTASESQAGSLENHALTLVKRGMYAEAQKVLEASIAIRPEGSGPYSILAECYLRQGIEPQRALELVEKALHNKGASLWTRLVDRFRWAEFWGNKAWALALMGSHAEAEKTLDTAFRMAPRDFKAEMAMLYYRAAQVAQLRGDNLKARELLEQGGNLDPQGGAGRLVATALKEL